MFFPRVIMLICNHLSDGNLRVEKAVNFIIVLLTAIGIVKLLRTTLPPATPLPWGLIFAGNLLLFPPMQNRTGRDRLRAYGASRQLLPCLRPEV